MIGRLRGTLLEKHPPHLLVDVGGVGYEVQASLTTVLEMPAVGAEVILHTQMVVREDAQQLFGFASTAERELFRSLVRVTGVGPKVALGILSGMTPSEFVAAVRRSDLASLVKLPGIGKKTAERLLVEMRDRVETLGFAATTPALVAAPAETGDALQEAEHALIALGYRPQDATRMIEAARREVDETSSEALIRAALRSMTTR